MPIARKTLVIFLVIGFASLWAAAIITYSKLEGSAFRGHVREGTYTLSLGHGRYQQTTRERFEAIRHKERLTFIYMAAAGVSWLGAAFLSRKRQS